MDELPILPMFEFEDELFEPPRPWWDGEPFDSICCWEEQDSLLIGRRIPEPIKPFDDNWFVWLIVVDGEDVETEDGVVEEDWGWDDDDWWCEPTTVDEVVVVTIVKGEGGDGVIRLEDGLVLIVIGEDETELIKPIPPPPSWLESIITWSYSTPLLIQKKEQKIRKSEN